MICLDHWGRRGKEKEQRRRRRRRRRRPFFFHLLLLLLVARGQKGLDGGREGERGVLGPSSTRSEGGSITNIKNRDQTRRKEGPCWDDDSPSPLFEVNPLGISFSSSIWSVFTGGRRPVQMFTLNCSTISTAGRNFFLFFSAFRKRFFGIHF